MPLIAIFVLFFIGSVVAILPFAFGAGVWAIGLQHNICSIDDGLATCYLALMNPLNYEVSKGITLALLGDQAYSLPSFMLTIHFVVLIFFVLIFWNIVIPYILRYSVKGIIQGVRLFFKLVLDKPKSV